MQASHWWFPATNTTTYVCCCIEYFAVKSGAGLQGLPSEMLMCYADQSVGTGVRSWSDDGDRALVVQEGQARSDWWPSLVVGGDSSSTKPILAHSAFVMLSLSTLYCYARQCNVLWTSGQWLSKWLQRRSIFSVTRTGQLHTVNVYYWWYKLFIPVLATTTIAVVI